MPRYESFRNVESLDHPDDGQFDATAEREFKFKFSTSEKLMLNSCQCLHRLCSDLHLAQVWNGRDLELYIYLCKSFSPSVGSVANLN